MGSPCASLRTSRTLLAGSVASVLQSSTAYDKCSRHERNVHIVSACSTIAAWAVYIANVKGLPLKVTLPVGVPPILARDNILISVVLPAPDGPMTAITSPFLTLAETFCGRGEAPLRARRRKSAAVSTTLVARRARVCGQEVGIAYGLQQHLLRLVLELNGIRALLERELDTANHLRLRLSNQGPPLTNQGSLELSLLRNVPC